MDLVDHEHLVAIPGGANGEVADDDFADVVDAGVGCRVDLEHIEIAPLGNLDAGLALTTRIRSRAVHAVQRTRQNPSGRGLADASRAGKDKRLCETAAAERVAKRRGDVLLP